jgi:very-short-patch-repair endonuclease
VELLKERNPEVILLSEKRAENGRVYCQYKTTFDETIKKREWSLLISKDRVLRDQKVKKEENEAKDFEKDKAALKIKHPDFELIERIHGRDPKVKYYRYKCRCGNVSIKPWYAIFNYDNCIKCKGTNLLSVEEKQKMLNIKGLKAKILSQYIEHNGKSMCKFICPNCGEVFEKYWDNLKSNGICTNCTDKRKKTLEERQISADIYNPGIKIINEFKRGGDWWVKYKCVCGRTEEKKWEKIRQGEHCNHCAQSRGENAIERFLDSNNINLIRQKEFDDLFGLSGYRKLLYDFYLPDYNLLIEYDGQFHFGVINISHSKKKNEEHFLRQKEHDKIKNEYVKNNGIKLLRIPYTEYENIENILKTELNL